jgi:hypothetical protein|tara:strand:- start:139 stop:831 length:693 start_codon:yes stop_codon:yes gene_type:complete
MEPIRNNRFRIGSSVDIYHSPVYEAYTVSIVEIIEGTGLRYTMTLPIDADITLNQVQTGDYAAFGFGVGVVNQIASEGNVFNITFETSAWLHPEVQTHLGGEIQHVLFFKSDSNVENGFLVANYKEEVSIANYGYARTVYNTEVKGELVLTPIRRVEDGALSNILYSTGYILKSCNTEQYSHSSLWDGSFPLGFSGASVYPSKKRASLAKRKLTSRGRKTKTSMVFELLG